jgi:hypothetical protein
MSVPHSQSRDISDLLEVLGGLQSLILHRPTAIATENNVSQCTHYLLLAVVVDIQVVEVILDSDWRGLE